MDEKDKEAARKALLDLIEECRKGSDADATAPERLHAVSEAVDVLMRL